MNGLEKYWRDARSLGPDAALAWRSNGVRGVWDEVAERTTRRLWRQGRLLVVAQPLAAGAERLPPAGVTIAPLADSDWRPLAELVTARRLARVREAAARGRILMVAWRGPALSRRPVGYAWLSMSMEPGIETYRLPLPADAVYLWGLWVHPEERRAGIGAALGAARARFALERGYAQGWRLVAPANVASMRTLERAAEGRSRVVGSLCYLKLGRRLRQRYTSRGEAE